MNVTVNKDLCTGCGICETVCPEVFRMKADGGKNLAVVDREAISEEVKPFCEDARYCCKSRAIQIDGESGSQPETTLDRMSRLQASKIAAALQNDRPIRL